MEAQPALNDLLRGVSASQLREPCTDMHLADIAGKVVQWETFAPYMSIDEAEEEEIKSNHRTYLQQKLACLRKWKSKYGQKATYQHLIQIFCRAGQVDLSCKVAEMIELAAPISPQTKRELDEYHQYLVEQYLQDVPPGTAEFPFIPAADFHYFKLSLQMRTSAKVHVASLEMEDIFTYGTEERKVTLIQGAAGSGKSTFVWELKRRWARGELYPEIQLLISINLRDPQYHMAKALTDIIPCPDRCHRISHRK